MMAYLAPTAASRCARHARQTADTGRGEVNPVVRILFCQLPAYRIPRGCKKIDIRKAVGVGIILDQLVQPDSTGKMLGDPFAAHRATRIVFDSYRGNGHRNWEASHRTH